MCSEAKVPIIVDRMQDIMPSVKELKNAQSTALSLKSSKNHLKVNPLKTILDFVVLNAKIITIIIGVYRNKKTKKKHILDIIFSVIQLNSPSHFF